MSSRLRLILGFCTILGIVEPCYGLSPEEVREAVLPSVALVAVTRDPLQPGSSAPASVLWQGSGFVVDQTSHRLLTECAPALTQNHANIAISFGKSWWAAEMADQGCTFPGALTALTLKRQIAGPTNSFPKALQIQSLSLNDDVSIGSEVYVVGFANLAPIVIRGRYGGTELKHFLLEITSTPDRNSPEAIIADLSGLHGGPAVWRDKVFGVVAASSREASNSLFPGGVPKGTYYVRRLTPEGPLPR